MTKLIYAYGLLLVFSNLALSSTLAQANTTIGPSACFQSDFVSATCSQSLSVDNVTATAATIFSGLSALLNVGIDANHAAGADLFSAQGTAISSFQLPLVITGGSGTGTLVVSLSAVENISGSATRPQDANFDYGLFGPFALGGRTVLGPALTPFSLVTRFNFGTPLNFAGTLSAQVQLSPLMPLVASSSHIDGAVNLIGFKVLDSLGNPVNAVVTLVPEPKMSLVIGAIFMVLFAWPFRRKVLSRSIWHAANRT